MHLLVYDICRDERDCLTSWLGLRMTRNEIRRDRNPSSSHRLITTGGLAGYPKVIRRYSSWPFPPCFIYLLKLHLLRLRQGCVHIPSLVSTVVSVPVRAFVPFSVFPTARPFSLLCMCLDRRARVPHAGSVLGGHVSATHTALPVADAPR